MIDVPRVPREGFAGTREAQILRHRGDERRVERIGEFRRGVALTEVAHRAVIHQIERAIRTKHRRHRSVDAAQAAGEGLVRYRLAGCSTVRVMSLIGLRTVEGEPRLLHREALAGRAEVDQFDIVPRGRLAILFREPEVSLAGHQRRSAPHDAVDEGMRREVESDGRDVRRLKGQRRFRWLGREGKHRLLRAGPCCTARSHHRVRQPG
jgi:hypothetical protein